MAAAVASTALAVGGPVSVSAAEKAKPPTAVGEQDRFLVVGHRGASGYRPEHTLAAYQLAIDLGADYIEPDLVSTKDGVLVARHENEIGGTTDVASRSEFASRKAVKTVDGVRLEGWFTEDFTLAELKSLRAKERIPATRQENTLYDGRFEIPTLQEVIDLAKVNSKGAARPIGIYPETKHPTYFDGIGLSLEEPLLRTLDANGYRTAKDPVFLQSFEVGNLRELAAKTDLRIVQLFGGSGRPWDQATLTYDQMATAAGLAEIATYADGVGPNKGRVIPVVAGSLGTPTSFVRDAHAVDLIVHPYTFRNESTFLPEALRRGDRVNDYGDAFAEYDAFLKAGVDGLFSDNPDTADAARDARAAA